MFLLNTKMIRLLVPDNNDESSSVALGFGFGGIMDI
jgi:hypothetical protein